MPAARAAMPTRRMSARAAFVRITLFVVVFAALAAVATLLIPSARLDPGQQMFTGSLALMVAAIVGGMLLVRRLDHRPARAIGITFSRTAVRDAAAGLGIGLLSIGVAGLVMYAAGDLRYTGEPGDGGAWTHAILRGLVFLAAGAASEEALFRGYPFQVLARAASPLIATVAVSTLFAIAHAWNPNVTAIALANIFLAGVMLSTAYLRTRTLWLATGVHLGWNWGMASLLDLPVSGLDFLETPRYEPVLHGATWFTGGGFGPEGGIAATIGFLVAWLAVRRLPGLDEAPDVRALLPLVDMDETGER
jgi:CAAX protease family protein